MSSRYNNLAQLFKDNKIKLPFIISSEQFGEEFQSYQNEVNIKNPIFHNVEYYDSCPNYLDEEILYDRTVNCDWCISYLKLNMIDTS